MPWFYVDDGFSDSKPVLNMPDRHRLAACGLWVLAGSWSAKEELDGFVPDSKLRQLGARPTLLAALTEKGPMSAPLCERTSRGIQFNSWEKWQKTREELAEKRREDAERQRAWREAHPEAKVSRKPKGRGATTSSNTDTSQRDTTVTNGVTAPIAEPIPGGVSQRDLARTGARPDPTRPDPTIKKLSGHLRDDDQVSNAHDDPPPPEPPFDPGAQPSNGDVVHHAPQHVDNPARPTKPHPTYAAVTVVRQELGNAGYPRDTINQLAIYVSKLAREGQPDELIRRSLHAWDRCENAIPAWLPNILGDLVKATRAIPGTNGHDAKVNDYLAMANTPQQEIEA